jgi:hypothetical protein
MSSYLPRLKSAGELVLRKAKELPRASATAAGCFVPEREAVQRSAGELVLRKAKELPRASASSYLRCDTLLRVSLREALRCASSPA